MRFHFFISRMTLLLLTPWPGLCLALRMYENKGKIQPLFLRSSPSLLLWKHQYVLSVGAVQGGVQDSLTSSSGFSGRGTRGLLRAQMQKVLHRALPGPQLQENCGWSTLLGIHSAHGKLKDWEVLQTQSTEQVGVVGISPYWQLVARYCIRIYM